MKFKGFLLTAAIMTLGAQAHAQGVDVNGIVGNALRQAQQATDQALGQAGMERVPAPTGGQNFMNSDLTGQSFRGKDLRGANLTNFTCAKCDFSGADLQGATLLNVEFTDSAFVRTDFRGAKMTNVTFTGGDSRGSNVDGATLFNVEYTGGVKLNGVNFTNSQMTNVTYEGADFNDAAVVTSQQIQDKLLAQEPSGKPADINLTIQFAYDSDKILPEAWPQLEELANALSSGAMKGNQFEIQGHTDSNGSDEYNMDLSYRRALSVRKALVEKFSIHPANLRTKGYGESKPIASNDEEYGRALNRRVTIVNLGRVAAQD